MDLTGYLPKLLGSDPLSAIVAYSEEMLARLSKQRVQIARYTTSGNRTNFATGNQVMDLFSYQAAGSDTNMASTPAAGTLRLPAGTYNIQLNVQLFADAQMTQIKPATGRSFIDIANGADAYSRTPIPTAEDQATGVTIGVKLTAANNDIIFKVLQTTGGTAYYRATATIMRVSQA